MTFKLFTALRTLQAYWMQVWTQSTNTSIYDLSHRPSTIFLRPSMPSCGPSTFFLPNRATSTL
jgi:hypothetical protein